MKIQEYTDSIGDLVGQNNLEMALKRLMNLFQNSTRLNEVIIQSSNFNELKDQIRRGIVNIEDAKITKNKIRIAILELAEEINEHSKIDSNVKNEIEKHLKNNNSMNIITQQHYGKGDNIAGNKIMHK